MCKYFYKILTFFAQKFVDFCANNCYYFICKYANIPLGGITMENNKSSKFGWLVFIITSVAAITAAVTAFLIIKEKKKKDEEQLEEYLDCSIL